jgi:hypothetical protein
MTYLGKQIFDKTPLIESQNTITNDYIEIGKEYKKQEKVTHKPTNREFQWSYIGNFALTRELRSFIRSNLGRYGAFWLPSFKSDFEFIGYDVNNVNQFTAKATNRTYGTYNIKRHIYMPFLNFAAKITFVQDNGDGTETIALNSAVPSGITQDAVITYLFYVRFNQDDFTTTKKGMIYENRLSFVELQGETP